MLILFLIFQETFECPEYFYRHVDYHSESDENKVNVMCLWNGMC